MILPAGIGPKQLNVRAPGLSAGLMSAGLGKIPAPQTYLDIGQGNRAFKSLYDRSLPSLLLSGTTVPRWNEVVARARSAPADIVPGLLASTLQGSTKGAIAARADRGVVGAALIVADERGRVRRGRCGRSCPPGLTVRVAELGELPDLTSALRGDDLLIAIERPPPAFPKQLTIGIAGRGFRGQLISDSTRTRNLVLSTDLAPTVLRRFGIEPPGEMSGRPIRAEGEPDPQAAAALEERLTQIGPRRGPVIGLNILAWLLIVALVSALRGRAAACVALPMFALSCVYLPPLVLLAAALEPIEIVEVLLIGLGAPLLAALTLRYIRGYAALAVACAVAVGAYVADLLAGTGLTARSLMGPNPAIGVRFFGIGNELEASLACAVLMGASASLAAGWPRVGSRGAVAWFLGVSAAAAAVLGAGRFGADVGAVIVLAVGGSVAAAVVAGIERRRALILAVATPLIGMAGLVALDLVLGGGAHLTRSVLEAGGFDQLADVVERRLRLSASSFVRFSNVRFLFVGAILIGLGIVYRDRILEFFADRRAALAGLAGIIAATAVGTLANDSGALLLMIGVAYLCLYVAFAWGRWLGLTPEAGERRNGTETPVLRGRNTGTGTG